MGKIVEASDLPEGTKIYLKKDWTGWRVVEPIKDENNKFLWKRILLGTRKEKAFLGFIIFLVLMGYLAFNEQLDNYKSVLNNPCAYCTTCQENNREFLKEFNKRNFNSSKLNITFARTNG